MLEEIIILVLLTFIPGLELRASIPYGILVLGMNWLPVFLICVTANIILGPLIYLFLDKIINLFLRIRWIKKCYEYYIKKTQKRISRYVERYGVLGVSLFIGIPLPGSGSYSGALGSHIIGVDFKKFTLANILGVLIAGVLVLIACISGLGAFRYFVRII